MSSFSILVGGFTKTPQFNKLSFESFQNTPFSFWEMQSYSHTLAPGVGSGVICCKYSSEHKVGAGRC